MQGHGHGIDTVGDAFGACHLGSSQEPPGGAIAEEAHVNGAVAGMGVGAGAV